MIGGIKMVLWHVMDEYHRKCGEVPLEAVICVAQIVDPACQ